MDRLAALDRRVVGVGRRDLAKVYDAPFPWWLAHGWLIGPLMLPLVFIAGPPSQHPLRVTTVSLGVVGTWLAFTLLWVRRHRIRE